MKGELPVIIYFKTSHLLCEALKTKPWKNISVRPATWVELRGHLKPHVQTFKVKNIGICLLWWVISFLRPCYALWSLLHKILHPRVNRAEGSKNNKSLDCSVLLHNFSGHSPLNSPSHSSLIWKLRRYPGIYRRWKGWLSHVCATGTKSFIRATDEEQIQRHPS